MKQYKVVGACAHVKTLTDQGVMTKMLFRGAIVPPDVPEQQIRHLLSVRLIREVGEWPGTATPTPSAVPDEDVDSPQPGGHQPVVEQPDPEVVKRREEARAKLPADGAQPDGRAGQAVWVEYAVSKGYAYDAVKDLAKDELRDLLAGKN